MNYLAQINFFWRQHDQDPFGTTEIALYFQLLDICNKCGWANPFSRQNNKICADLGISKPTLDTARNKLQQRGMIAFKSKGKGDGNIKYGIVEATEKENNFTTSFTTSFTTPFTSSFPHNINLNKNIEVVEFKAAIDFFKNTKNYGLLSQKNKVAAAELDCLFETFYNSKVDLGEFKGKTPQDLVKHFTSWLPIHLQIEKRQQEAQSQPASPTSRAGQPAPERGLNAALTRVGNLKMR